MKKNVSVVRFKFLCNILISGTVTKEMPGSVASGTRCIYHVALQILKKKTNSLFPFEDGRFSLHCYTRCSPNHAMVYTENGTYTAVRRRVPHHCTRSTPEAMPLPNRRVLSAAPCRLIISPVSYWKALGNGPGSDI